MSEIKVSLDNNLLKIEQIRPRQSVFDTAEIDVNTLVYDKSYKTDMKVLNKKYMNRLLFLVPYTQQEKLNNDEEDNDMSEEDNIEDMDVLAVWTNEKTVKYGYRKINSLYREFFKFRYKLLYVGLNKRNLSVWVIGYFTQYSQDVLPEDIRFYIDEANSIHSDMQMRATPLPIYKVLSLRNIHHYKIPIKNLLTDETQINNTLNMVVKVNGHNVEFRLGKKKRRIRSKRLYYAPYKSCYTNGYAVHLRRTDRGNFAIVKRPMEEREHTLYFRFMESKPVSCLLYHWGKWRSSHAKRNVNLFYEKFSEKAEEGTFDLFKIARDKGTADNYYIIDEKSADYQKIQNEKNVVKKYSLKYYRLLYSVNNYISTEAPAHLNILRSNNKYFRMSTVEHPFIFLQHGITYLKCQGPSSTFVSGKEGEPTYMIVGSEKELDVCADMLKMTEDRFLNTGLPIFGKVEYNHICQDSADKAVIMLTWKSYEEHIQNFEESEYYKSVMEIYHMLQRYMPAENILIVAHPKMAEHFAGTKMEDSLWKEPISKVLEVAKLLITDYSSACYNSFYQGGAVLFYQPDLERYEAEAGKLIPHDDEYIGYRTFTMKELEEKTSDIIRDGKIILEKGRTKEHEEMYRTINEYTDGKNIERIFATLNNMGIL